MPSRRTSSPRSKPAPCVGGSRSPGGARGRRRAGRAGARLVLVQRLSRPVAPSARDRGGAGGGGAHGAGAGGSRLVTGNHAVLAALEARLARHKGKDAALVFGSGYLANLGITPALAGRAISSCSMNSPMPACGRGAALGGDGAHLPPQRRRRPRGDPGQARRPRTGADPHRARLLHGWRPAPPMQDILAVGGTTRPGPWWTTRTASAWSRTGRVPPSKWARCRSRSAPMVAISAPRSR